jgi:hypothetical protein
MLPLVAQKQKEERSSPLAMATYKYKNTYIKVTYGAPAKRGREVFGSLVPYGKVWRTGANEATEITFTRNVLIAGQPLAAGTYTLFTIPNERKWSVLFNSELGQWGAYKYDEKKNVLTVSAIPIPVEETEVFACTFEAKDALAYLTLTWDKTRVSLPISFVESDTPTPKSQD